MQTFWLANMSVALDGSRYLSRVDPQPQISFVDRITVGTGSSDSVSSVVAFLEGLRFGRIARLELRWLGRSSDQFESEFGVVTVPEGQAWRLYSTFTFGGTSHGWDGVFRSCPVFAVETSSVEEATDMLTQLLDGAVNHPVESHRAAVATARSILSGVSPVPQDVFGIRIDDLDDHRSRLLAAAVALASWKLSGMGGFDDSSPPGVAHLDPVSIVGQAIAAATTNPRRATT